MLRFVATSTLRATQRSALTNTTYLPRIHNFRVFTPRYLSSESGDEKLSGVVKWFDVKKGYGFIIPNDGSPDIFVHFSALHSKGFQSLAQGETVEFGLTEESDGRRKAVKVSGPDGDFVQGAPRPESLYSDDDDGFFRDDSNQSHDGDKEDGWDNAKY